MAFDDGKKIQLKYNQVNLPPDLFDIKKGLIK